MSKLKLIGLVVVVLLIATRPHQAAALGSSIGGTLFTWAGNAGTFLADLASSLPT